MKRHKYSRQRQAILDCLCATDTHPTADWIYQQLHPLYPKLSLGTVYRNLSLFKEEGLVKTVGVVAGQERLDGVPHPHSHFICEKCGAVMDVPGISADPAMLRRAEAILDCEVDNQSLQFTGVCKSCQAVIPTPQK